jgi:predicted transcriptional regulator
MSVDIAKKLNILAINSNRNKNYIVEELINNEYSKLKK